MVFRNYCRNPDRNNYKLHLGDEELNINPYQSPQRNPVEPLDPVSDARRRLSKPATALIVMSSINAVLVAIPMVAIVINLFNGIYHGAAPLLFCIYFMQLASLIFIAIGAAKMGHLESYRLGRFAGILACIPMVSPFMILGIPFGIWSLKLLGLNEIKTAFHSRLTSGNTA